MKPGLAFVLFVLVAAWNAPGLHAAPLASPTPSITITSPANGAVVHGPSVTVRVAVSNFTLVAPGVSTRIRGNAGRVVYSLDATTTYNATNVASMLSHTWKGLKPGTHSLIAYLVGRNGLAFPGAHQAAARITVAAPSPTPRPTPASTPAGRGGSSPGVGTAPVTGGGDGRVFPSLDINLLLAGILAILVGSVLIRRYAFATTGRAGNGEPADSAPQSPIPQPQAAFDASGSSAAPPPGDGPPDDKPSGPAEPETPASEPAIESSPWDMPVPAPPAQASAESESTQEAATSTAPSAAATEEGSLSARALEMTQQWSELVQDLVRQLEGAEAEREQMLARISALEQTVRQHEALQHALADLPADEVSTEEMQAVQYVTDSLVKDPDHIVVLASVAQNADKIARIVRGYVRIQRALGDF
ncbi:MAG TPA: hypothetical protein VKX16_01930 [Chloroflexota bacterium]|nr:hypothetical protein [Chloroflexota bacterium]